MPARELVLNVTLSQDEALGRLREGIQSRMARGLFRLPHEGLVGQVSGNTFWCYWQNEGFRHSMRAECDGAVNAAAHGATITARIDLPAFSRGFVFVYLGFCALFALVGIVGAIFSDPTDLLFTGAAIILGVFGSGLFYALTCLGNQDKDKLARCLEDLFKEWQSPPSARPETGNPEG